MAKRGLQTIELDDPTEGEVADVEVKAPVELDDASLDEDYGLDEPGEFDDMDETMLEPDGEDPPEEEDHFRNLVDEIDVDTLSSFVNDLDTDIARDAEQRSSYIETLKKAIENLGIESDGTATRDDPFPGASNVFHPMLALAALEFQARIMREMFPPGGPIRVRPTRRAAKSAMAEGASGPAMMAGAPPAAPPGPPPPDLASAAAAPPPTDPFAPAPAPAGPPPGATPAAGGPPGMPGAAPPAPEGLPPALLADMQAVLNFHFTHGSPGNTEVHDRLWMQLPIYGSMFVYTLPNDEGVPVGELHGPEDVIVPWNAKTLMTAPRVTLVLRKFEHEVEALQLSGVWSTVDLEKNEEASKNTVPTSLEDSENEAVGITNSGDPEDDRFVIYQVNVFGRLEAKDDEETPLRPYTVTYLPGDNQVLAVRRAWAPDDAMMRRIMPLTHYKFMQGFGFYGIGLFQIMGGLVKAGTGSLRALLDTAALSLFPRGFVDKAMDLKNNKLFALGPNQWQEIGRDIAANGQKRPLSDHFYQYPNNPPPPVLFQLLEWLTKTAKDVASVVVTGLAEASQGQPVGTTLALIEQQSVIFTSLYTRQFDAFAEEIKQHIDIMLESGLEEWDNDEGVFPLAPLRDRMARVVPAADKGTFSIVQKLMRAQATFQLATQTKGLGVETDIRSAAIALNNAMDGEDSEKIWPEKKKEEPPKPMNPAAEFAAVIKGEPVKAVSGQFHMAHVRYLEAKLKDPSLQSAIQKALPAIEALIVEHIGQDALDQMTATVGMELPPEVPQEAQGDLAKIAADAAEQLTLQRIEQANDTPEARAMRAENERRAEADRINGLDKLARALQDKEALQAKLDTQREIAAEKNLVAIQIAEMKAESDAVKHENAAMKLELDAIKAKLEAFAGMTETV